MSLAVGSQGNSQFYTEPYGAAAEDSEEERLVADEFEQDDDDE